MSKVSQSVFQPRAIDVEADRIALLEFHCLGNYESDPAWAKAVPYDDYRAKWLATPQPETFLSSLPKSIKDSRTIAEIWEHDGQAVAFLWVTFVEISGYDLTIAEVNDLEVSPEFHRRGIGSRMMEHAEQMARERGADLLRTETGVANVATQALLARSGFQVHRLQYEKVLSDNIK